MKKILFPFTLTALAVAAAGIIMHYNADARPLSAIELENIEALSTNEGGGGSFGCPYAAYEWDNDWYEDTKNFMVCRSGCPIEQGTSPKYRDC